jgi:hypothetical protein
VKRRLFNVLAAVSLLLCMVSVAIWKLGDSLEVYLNPGPAYFGPALYWFDAPLGFIRVTWQRNTESQWDWDIAWWKVGAALAVLTLFMLHRGASPRSNGVCPNCGYDLRATPQRCPECGLLVKPTA